MTAGRTAEYAIFMLHADNIRLTDIEKLRGDTIIGPLVLVDLKGKVPGKYTPPKTRDMTAS
jgi:hypothetical protein